MSAATGNVTDSSPLRLSRSTEIAAAELVERLGGVAIARHWLIDVLSGVGSVEGTDMAKRNEAGAIR